MNFLLKVAAIVLVLFLFKSGTDTGARTFKRIVDWGKSMVQQSNLDTIARQLRTDYGFDARFPRDFPEWIRESIDTRGGGDPAEDLWGSLLELYTDLDGVRGAFEVCSCGPDQSCETDDDVVVAGVAARIE